MGLSFIINKKRWRFLRERLPNYVKDGVTYEKHGDCDPPTVRDKAIRVSTRMKDKDELETIIHEVRHAENWDMYDELYVERRSAELANLLWKLGYRKTTPEKVS